MKKSNSSKNNTNNNINKSNINIDSTDYSDLKARLKAELAKLEEVEKRKKEEKEKCSQKYQKQQGQECDDHEMWFEPFVDSKTGEILGVVQFELCPYGDDELMCTQIYTNGSYRAEKIACSLGLRGEDPTEIDFDALDAMDDDDFDDDDDWCKDYDFDDEDWDDNDYYCGSSGKYDLDELVQRECIFDSLVDTWEYLPTRAKVIIRNLVDDVEDDEYYDEINEKSSSRLLDFIADEWDNLPKKTVCIIEDLVELADDYD